jgi:hypothetical protein
MHLRAAILEEHSRKQMLRIVDYVGNDKTRFKALMQLFLYDEYRVSQRAAWAVSNCIQQHPELTEKYLPILLDNLKNPVHNAVIRNTIRILDMVEIPKKLHAQVINICYEYVAGRSTPIAVKAFSLSVLHKLSKIYPELKTELKSLIEDQLPTATAAFKSKAKKIKL